MGNLALFHPELNGVITLLTTASRGPPLKIKTPPEVGTIDSSSEGSWLQGGTEHNAMSRFLCRASKWWEFHGCFNPSPQIFVEAHEWVVVPCTILLSFSLRIWISLSVWEWWTVPQNPFPAEGKVWLRKWPDQLLANCTASFKPRCITIGSSLYLVFVCIFHTSVFGCKFISISIHMFMYIFVFISIYIYNYIFICMYMYVQSITCLLGICRRQWGARSKQKQLEVFFLSRMQPSSISRMLMGAEPSYCHRVGHGFHAFFRFESFKVGPLYCYQLQELRSSCHSPYILVYFRTLYDDLPFGIGKPSILTLR